ncbi:hypothetical protein TRFO_12299 [Tritrichomonas foetus]|uniref:Uncharacterized protein n=1 Tax=Tritrichomonas foetus TaxID=1144522 RepID=A0A1J4J3L5_9EUKA|nr:hypothetical protein TRFO_12299 [Tritrichomonas foetus]|eukprot:OHS92751.1 hypothetical protein TRFO_12299 [Tritrichomonas foetus]
MNASPSPNWNKNLDNSTTKGINLNKFMKSPLYFRSLPRFNLTDDFFLNKDEELKNCKPHSARLLLSLSDGKKRDTEEKNSRNISLGNSNEVSNKNSGDSSINLIEGNSSPINNQKDAKSQNNDQSCNSLNSSSVDHGNNPQNYEERKSSPLNKRKSILGNFNENPEDEVTDERCQEIIENFKKHKYLPGPYHERNSAFQYIIKQILELMINKEYKAASEMNDLRDSMLKAIDASDKAEVTFSKEESIKYDLQLARDKIKTIQEKWQQRIDKFVQECGEKMMNLIEIHETQIKEFIQFYNNIDNLRKYSKPSSTLLQIRAKERYNVLSHRYTDAKAMKIAAARIEKEETLKAQETAEFEIINRKKKLIEQQNKEVAFLNDYQDRTIYSMKEMMNNEIETVMKRIKFLENMLKSNQKAVIAVIDSSTLDPIGMQTPDMRKRYLDFRSSSTGGKIIIKPIVGLAQKTRNNRMNRDSLGK